MAALWGGGKAHIDHRDRRFGRCAALHRLDQRLDQRLTLLCRQSTELINKGLEMASSTS